MDFRRLHTARDVDMGRIPDNPAVLGGHRIPKSTYATEPFRFGGDNFRFYYPQPEAVARKLKDRK